MTEALNKNSAASLLRFFDVCFKRGVEEAYRMEDDYAVRDFVFLHESPASFGSLMSSEEVDWRSFRFVLYRWARESNMTPLAENCILAAKRCNYLWCIFPFCMWFYLMGVKEWLGYPSPQPLEVFKMTPRVHWNPKVTPSKITRMDFISYMHEAAFAYRRLDGSAKGVSDRVMDGFCQAVYMLTRE